MLTAKSFDPAVRLNVTARQPAFVNRTLSINKSSMLLRQSRFPSIGDLNIADSQVDDLTILVLQGEIIFGAPRLKLHEALCRHIEAGRTRLALDLQGVTFLDSSGLGELVSALVCVQSRGGYIRLLNIPSNVAQVLKVTGLTAAFDTSA